MSGGRIPWSSSASDVTCAEGNPHCGPARRAAQGRIPAGPAANRANLLLLPQPHFTLLTNVFSQGAAIHTFFGKNNFHNLKIDALRIEEKDNGFKLLIINLLENENFIIPNSLGHYRTWFDFFQGSMGGEATSIILKESILQRNYEGTWIDELEVYYQNEPIGQWDHIQLSGIILRN